MKYVFLDTNVGLDLMIHRAGTNAAQSIFKLAHQGKIKLYISAQSYAVFYYVLRKHHGRQIALQRTKDLYSLVNVLDMDAVSLKYALESDWPDTEDAMLYFVALKCKMDVIVTSNLTDFKLSRIPTLSPDHFLTLI